MEYFSMINEPTTRPTTIDEAFQAGLDDRGFGGGPVAAPDPETATDDDLALYEARREAYGWRSDLDEEGEVVDNDQQRRRP
jgi:hypothetical protein